MSNLTVGQKVRAKAPIYEPADEYAPGGYLCNTHDVLIVREVNPRHIYPIKVSHEHITDRSFGAMPDELEPMPNDAKACLSPDGMPNHCVLWKCHEAKTCARGVMASDGSQR